MNEFLLLALLILYLAISYAPASRAPKDNWETYRSEQSSRGNVETDGR